jgi:hypothetical protein
MVWKIISISSSTLIVAKLAGKRGFGCPQEIDLSVVDKAVEVIIISSKFV